MTRFNKAGRNNFDLLRLLFAMFVIITHSFVLAGVSISEEPLYKISHEQLSFSFIGLHGFFIISGFLIYQSFERSSSVSQFLANRFLRIFPGLISISVLTIFIIGPIISSLEITNYLTQKNTYLVFFESIDLFFQRNTHSLPGIFEKNIYGPEINGSLWTISYEFVFYMGFIIFFFYRKRRSFIFITLAISLCVIIFFKVTYLDPWFKYEYFIPNSEIGLKTACDFALYFTIGCFFAFIRYDSLDKKHHILISGTTLLVMAVLLYLNLLVNFSLLLICPLILSLCLIESQSSIFTKRVGDLSYGIYLSGFFIQQILMSFYPFSPYQLMFFSLILSFLYALFSWNFVERPMLKKKDKFRLNFATI